MEIFNMTLFQIICIFLITTINAGEFSKFCVTIDTAKNLTISKANLSWGKWINEYNDYTEVGSPQGMKIKNGTKITLCSSGRAYSPSGTTGEILLIDEFNGRLTIIWEISYIFAPWLWDEPKNMLFNKIFVKKNWLKYFILNFKI